MSRDEYIHEWKAARGYYDPGRGWLPDDECDWWEDMRKAHESALRAALPRSLNAWRRLFGLIPPSSSTGMLDKDEVRSRVDMLALVSSRGGTLRPHGTRATGRCPFHEDRLASFSVDLDRKLWHCFAGCGGGDCFNFVMKADECTFGEAIKTLNSEF